LNETLHARVVPQGAEGEVQRVHVEGLNQQSTLFFPVHPVSGVRMNHSLEIARIGNLETLSDIMNHSFQHQNGSWGERLFVRHEAQQKVTTRIKTTRTSTNRSTRKGPPRETNMLTQVLLKIPIRDCVKRMDTLNTNMENRRVNGSRTRTANGAHRHTTGEEGTRAKGKKDSALPHSQKNLWKMRQHCDPIPRKGTQIDQRVTLKGDTREQGDSVVVVKDQSLGRGSVTAAKSPFAVSTHSVETQRTL
jgi:hypothetical protein